MSQGRGAVEEYLIRQLEARDQEVVELRRQVVRLQCSLLELQDRTGQLPLDHDPQQQQQQQPPRGAGAASAAATDTGALPQILLEGVAGVGPQRGGVSHRGRRSTSSVSSASTCGSDAAAAAAGVAGGASAQAPGARSPARAESTSRFVSEFLAHGLVSELIMDYAGDCRALVRTCSQLRGSVAQHCTVSLQLLQAWCTLEAGVHNESAYEVLSEALSRRWKTCTPKAVFTREYALASLHAFAQTQLKPAFNTLAFNVNNPLGYFVDGPQGMRPEHNRAVSARGLNLALYSTLHSSAQPVDYSQQLKWLQSRNLRLFYPRAAVPHMLGMLECMKKLHIQPVALVIDVCLVKPKWFPAIEFIREYPNVILVPEIPSKEALEEGEAQHIKEKFNRYLQSFATAGQCIYVVLDKDIAPAVAKEVRTSKANVLSLALPAKEGPTGLREYPLLELLTTLDSVFDDDFTLTVPAEREPLSPNPAAFSPAPGAGGVYKYTEEQTFAFCPPETRARHHGATGGCDDEDGGGVSDSSSYSVSSVSSVGSSVGRASSLGNMKRQDVDYLFKTRKTRLQARRQQPARGGGLEGSVIGGCEEHSVPLTAAEQKTTKKVAQECGFTLSITEDPESGGGGAVSGLPDTAPAEGAAAQTPTATPQPPPPPSCDFGGITIVAPDSASFVVPQTPSSAAPTTVGGAEEGGDGSRALPTSDAPGTLLLVENVPLNLRYCVKPEFFETNDLQVCWTARISTPPPNLVSPHPTQPGTFEMAEEEFTLRATGTIDGHGVEVVDAVDVGRVASHALATFPPGIASSGVAASKVRFWGVCPDPASAEALAATHVSGLEDVRCKVVVEAEGSDGRNHVGFVSSYSNASAAAKESLLAAVAEADVLYLDLLFLDMSPALLAEVVAACEARGTHIALRALRCYMDSPRIQENLTALLPHVAYFFAGEDELSELAERYAWQADSVRDLVRSARRLISASGMFVFSQSTGSVLVGTEAGVAGHPFPTIASHLNLRAAHDPTASFVGGFLARHCQGKEVAACVKAGFRQVVASLSAPPRGANAN